MRSVRLMVGVAVVVSTHAALAAGPARPPAVRTADALNAAELASLARGGPPAPAPSFLGAPLLVQTVGTPERVRPERRD